jgi:hypothetical protein
MKKNRDELKRFDPNEGQKQEGEATETATEEAPATETAGASDNAGE